jgi:vitamin B12 transporter
MWKRNYLGPRLVGIWLTIVPLIGRAQEASPTPSPGEGQAEAVIVSATRTEIPENESPASVSVITSDDLKQKQIERVADALREVPGLNVVQTGTPGQLTSVFMRGLPSEDMQVLLDGIPINQGLAGSSISRI